MNYATLNENRSNVDPQDKENDNLDDLNELKAQEDEMFEYYKKNKNLNYYVYQSDEIEWRNSIEEIEKIFFLRLNELKEKKPTYEEESKIEDSSIQNLKVTYSPQTIKKTRKHTENFGTRKQSDNALIDRLREKKAKFHFKKDGLDLDDNLVEAGLPTEYDEEKHEEKMRCLGEELMDCRKRLMQNSNTNFAREMRDLNHKEKKHDYSAMSNDDFNLFLCLLRKKKESFYEKNAYHVDYHIKIDDVYINEKDELVGTEEKEKNVYVNVENFVKMFIDNEPNINTN